MKSSLLAPTLLAIIIVAILFYSPYTAAYGSSSQKDPKCTQLGVYTFPVQKGPCIFFKHPSSHELEKANKANIEFNKGVKAGHLRTLTFNSTNQLNCPSGNTKEFCSGWKSATQFTLQQLAARQNYKSSHHE